MLAAIILQIASVLVLALGAGIVADAGSARFVLLGGAVAIIPNSLFAARLAVHQGKPSESYPVVFFLGQFGKIGLTLLLLYLVVKFAAPVNWPAMVAGLIVALKAPLFALWIARDDRPVPAGGPMRPRHEE